MTQRDRTTYIGSADVASIVGVCPYRTALDVYNSKVNGLTIKPNAAMKWGLLHEATVLANFSEIKSIPITETQVYAEHPQYSYLAGTADALTPEFVIEAKTTQEFNKSFKETIPDNYFIQVQWLMGLHNRKNAHVAVLKGSCTEIYYEIEFDKELYETLVTSACNFWMNHVLTKTPPTPKPIDSTFHEFDADVTAQATSDQIALINKYNALKAHGEHLSKEAQSIKDSLFESSPRAQCLLWEGKPVVRRTERTRESWDTLKLEEKLKDELPEYKKTSKYYEVRIL